MGLPFDFAGNIYMKTTLKYGDHFLIVLSLTAWTRSSDATERANEPKKYTGRHHDEAVFFRTPQKLNFFYVGLQ